MGARDGAGALGSEGVLLNQAAHKLEAAMLAIVSSISWTGVLMPSLKRGRQTVPRRRDPLSDVFPCGHVMRYRQVALSRELHPPQLLPE
jgi:hypothetical protein